MFSFEIEKIEFKKRTFKIKFVRNKKSIFFHLKLSLDDLKIQNYN